MKIYEDRINGEFTKKSALIAGEKKREDIRKKVNRTPKTSVQTITEELAS